MEVVVNSAMGSSCPLPARRVELLEKLVAVAKSLGLLELMM